MRFFLLSVVFLFFPLTTISAGYRDVSSFPVQSWREINPSVFNTKIRRAFQRREQWVRNPLIIVIRFLNRPNVRYTKIIRRDNRTENPTKTTITVYLDGFADDAIRGSWDRIRLERQKKDGPWKISFAHRAILGGRYNSPKVFTAK